MDGQGSLASHPELATNEEWRSLMRRARGAHKLTQKELATRVHTSQNTISLIESGEVGSSQYILPICEELSIPPPTWWADEDDRAWITIGRLLRARDLEVFRRALAMVEAMVTALPPDAGGGLRSDEEH